MPDSRASSRYVKSLLTLAVEQGVLEEVHQDMNLFAKVCHENRPFLLMLKNPVIRHDKKKEILDRLFMGKVHALTMAIFDIITRKNREPLLPEIAQSFHDAYNQYKGVGRAFVTTAIPLDPELRSQFTGIARKICGKDQIEIAEKVDDGIIGGFILNVGDQQVDASIRNKLNTLKIKLSSNPYIKDF